MVVVVGCSIPVSSVYVVVSVVVCGVMIAIVVVVVVMVCIIVETYIHSLYPTPHPLIYDSASDSSW